MERKFNTGLFIGRFQPFHKGHMHALEVASDSCKKLVIGIGSSQEAGTERNPLSARARIAIIKAALSGSSASRVKPRCIAIPDFKNNDAWFNYITQKIPKLDVVFSGNQLVKRIFRSHRITVITPRLYKRKRFSSTNVRKAIKEGKHWQDLVPRGAIREIERRYRSTSER